MKRTEIDPRQLSLSFPEITCPHCSGSMDIVEVHEKEIIPASSTLFCKSCGEMKEISFDVDTTNFVNQEFANKSSVCPLCHQLTLPNF